MLRHHLRFHLLDDLENTRFGWKILSKEQTGLRRQVSEALSIKESKEKENPKESLSPNNTWKNIFQDQSLYLRLHPDQHLNPIPNPDPNQYLNPEPNLNS